MLALIAGLSIVALAFVLHLVIWRVKLPHRQTRTLLLLFFAVMIAADICLYLFFEGGADLPTLVRVNALVVSFTLAYVISYSALEADSPSLVIIRLVSAAGPSGLQAHLLENELSDEKLVRPRVQDLVRDQLAYLENGFYRLTPKGRRFVAVFAFYRALLKAGKGG